MMKGKRVGYLEEHPEMGGMGFLYILLCELNRKILIRKLPGFESAFLEPNHTLPWR